MSIVHEQTAVEETRANGEGATAEANSQCIGAYEILELIGGGGMGLVYKVRHKGSGSVMALKTLRKELASDPVNVKRFQQELKTTSLLTHPNIVPIYDSGVAEDGCPFFVMEYLDGLTLEEILRDEGYLDLDRFFSIFQFVCEGLIASHEKRVIHRDLKPGNIMVCATDSGFELTKLLDFGIARVFQQASKDGVRLTQLGEILGSPQYMSPEQCLNQKLDERSDVYSLGIVMYEALAGQPPFSGDSAAQIIMAHLQDKPKSMCKVRPDFNIPSDLEALVMMSLEKESSLRYQSIKDLLEELKKISISAKTRTFAGAVKSCFRRAKVGMRRATRRIVENRKRWLSGAAAMSFLIAGGAVGYQVWLDHQGYKEFVDRAQLAQLHGKYDEVQSNWNQALKLFAKSNPPEIQMAMMWERAGDDLISLYDKRAAVSAPFGQLELADKDVPRNEWNQLPYQRREAAEQYYKRALSVYEKRTVAGQDRMRLLEKLVAIACIAHDSKAEEMYLRQCIATMDFQMAQQQGFQAYQELARVLGEAGKISEAIEIAKKQIDVEQSQDNNGPSQGLILLVSLYERAGRIDEAISLHRQIIRDYKIAEVNGSDYSYQIVEEFGKLAHLLERKGLQSDADICVKEADEITKKRKR